MQSTPASAPPVDGSDEVDIADALDEREPLDPPEVPAAVVDEFGEPAVSVPLAMLP